MKPNYTYESLIITYLQVHGKSTIDDLYTYVCQFRTPGGTGKKYLREVVSNRYKGSDIFEYDNPYVWLKVDPKTYYDIEFEKQLRSSRSLSEPARLKRLLTANKIPEKISILTIQFKRNADVVEQVLSKAAGICQKCNIAAPFIRRSDKAPYLEVHHIIPLASGGEDTVDNSIALCPNCHRQAHYG